MNDTSKISQIEQIVRFCWSGEQIIHGTLVHGSGCRHNRIPYSRYLWVEPLAKMPIHNPAENEGHGAVVELIDGDCVEVAEEAWCDWVPPTTGRPHSCNQQGIH